MIRFVRTASIDTGKLREALAFAREVSEYLNKQYSVKVEVFMPVGGNPNRVAWKVDYTSLDAMETMLSNMMKDPAYLELTARGGGNFIAGSVHDAIWKSV